MISDTFGDAPQTSRCHRTAALDRNSPRIIKISCFIHIYMTKTVFPTEHEMN